MSLLSRLGLVKLDDYIKLMNSFTEDKKKYAELSTKLIESNNRLQEENDELKVDIKDLNYQINELVIELEYCKICLAEYETRLNNYTDEYKDEWSWANEQI